MKASTKSVLRAAAVPRQAITGKISSLTTKLVRGLTGLDRSKTMAALSSGDWSPEQVAVRTLVGDGGARLQFPVEIMQCAVSFGGATRAALNVTKLRRGGWVKAGGAFAKQVSIRDMSFDTKENLVRLQSLWVETAEPIQQDIMGSPEYCDAQAEFIRKATKFSRNRSRILSRAARALEVPDREEMNDAYRAIQDLRREVRAQKRDVRQLQKGVPAERKTPAKTSKRKGGKS